MTQDLYATLGVARTATAEEIKKAYRRLAREHHPDANDGDAASEARFKEIAHAYEVLADPERRHRYDTFGSDSNGGMGGADPFGGGLGDIFDAFFGGSGGGGAGGFGGQRRRGGPPPGGDIEVVVDLRFEEAVFGTQTPVVATVPSPCDACEATGAKPGTHPETCATCGGAGQVRQVRQSILGQMVTAHACPTCSGMGQVIADPCEQCRGEGRRPRERTYTVDIPPGVANGNTLRLPGYGPVGPRGGPAGDLYVHLRVAPHERFTRDGDDLVHPLRLGVAQAALGMSFPFETLDGTEDVVIARGTQPDTVLRLRGRGVPRVRGRGRGDLRIEISVEVPRDLSDEEEQLLRQLATLRGEAVAEPESGLLSKIKSAFK